MWSEGRGGREGGECVSVRVGDGEGEGVCACMGHHRCPSFRVYWNTSINILIHKTKIRIQQHNNRLYDIILYDIKLLIVFRGVRGRVRHAEQSSLDAGVASGTHERGTNVSTFPVSLSFSLLLRLFNAPALILCPCFPPLRSLLFNCVLHSI